MTYVTMGSCCNSLPCHNSCDRMQAGQISWPLHEGQALFNVIRSPWMSHERKINCIRFRFLCYHRVIYCSLHYPPTSSYFFFLLTLIVWFQVAGREKSLPLSTYHSCSSAEKWAVSMACNHFQFLHPGHLWQLHLGFSLLADQLGRLQVHDAVYGAGL